VRGVFLGLLAAVAACSFDAPQPPDGGADVPSVVSFEFASSITDEAAQTANVRLELDRASAVDVTVVYEIAGGSAMKDIDFTLDATSVTFPAGDTNAVIPIGIVQDVAEEDDETIDLTITDVQGGELGQQATHELTISKNLLPRVAFTADTSMANEPDGAQAFGLALTVASSVDIVVSYSVTGSASAADHSLADGTVTIPAGMLTADLDDSITADGIDENDETVDVTITNATNAVIGPVAEHVHTIVDQDPPPTIGFAAASGSVNENAGSADVIVSLSIESGKQITVDVGVGAGGSAVAGADFSISPSSLTFAPGETMKVVTVSLVADGLDEDDETAALALSNPVNATLAQGTRTVTIVDGDAPPSISFAQASTTISEQNGPATIVVELSAASGKDITFSISSSGAAVTGTDFVLPAQPITIAAGATSKNLSVTITNDGSDEDDETATLSLIGLGNATPGSQLTHALTILDNDVPPQVRFDPNQGNRTVDEGDSGTQSFVYPVVLTVASGKTVTVGITRTGNASTPQDFTFGANEIPVTFAPGETSKNVTVIVKGDTQNEMDEAVTMTLQTPVNATNAGNNQTRTHTIKDDD